MDLFPITSFEIPYSLRILGTTFSYYKIKVAGEDVADFFACFIPKLAAFGDCYFIT